jgi:hypothetical protein
VDLDDFIEPEVGVAVAVTAALVSPPVRRVVRKGAVYGLAGLLIARDKLAGLASGLRQRAGAAAHPAEGTAAPAPAPAAAPS